VARCLPDVACRECDADQVYMDVKEEPRVYKIGAICHGCDYDYGVLTRVQRKDVDHIDDVYEVGEERVVDILDGR